MADTEFRFDLGSPWLNLIATVSGRRRGRIFDRLDRPARLDEWLALVDLAPRRRADEGDLAAAVELREAFYAVSRAVADGTSVPPSAVRCVDRALGHDLAVRASVADGALAVSRPATVQQALGRLARRAVDDLTAPGRPPLRACGDGTCASTFFDETGRRRWCNDATCGNRARVRAHRERTAAARRSD